jgi:CRISPR-associated protein Cas1
VRAQDRLTFLYLEHCIVHRDANAITARDAKGTVHISAATLSALLLGPGTRVSQQAMVLLAESGSTAVWVGEQGVRYYAHGRSLARSSRYLQAQAALVSNRRSRLRAARQMYAMRFAGEDTSRLSMQQLRGREGARVRRVYREQAERFGVPWDRRHYDPNDYTGGSPVNQALSAANTSLYGVVHAVIVALGCAPGLGFVHTGNSRSFVYDIADLYKADISIPIAFEIAARQGVLDIGAETRHAVRDHMRGGAFLETCVADVRTPAQRRRGTDPLPTGLVRGRRHRHALGRQRPTCPQRHVLRPGARRVRRRVRPRRHDRRGRMTVIVLAACPIGLRGHLTRWLLEISPGVFVGKISARVRDLMWNRVTDMTSTGRALMVYTANNEQGLAFRVHEHRWTPIEIEGIYLMLRPAPKAPHPARKDWSNASKRRRFGKR